LLPRHDITAAVNVALLNYGVTKNNGEEEELYYPRNLFKRITAVYQDWNLYGVVVNL
jgi:hypothetical protein